MTGATLPTGYSLIPAGSFQAGNLQGQAVAEFGMKKTPVTNAGWLEGLSGLGEDRFVLLDHNWDTGVTQLMGRGRDVESAVKGPVAVPENIEFDRGDVVYFGSRLLLKMVNNPSARYDEEGRVFSGEKQPVVGTTYFQDKVWNALQTLASNGVFQYRLPTDLEYEYVASDRGIKDYGTETGGLYGPDGRKLAHIDEYNNGKGTTVAVDDPRYVQDLPFGVQTTGNVWRRTEFSPAFKQSGNYFWGPFGLRGGSWYNDEVDGRASFRHDYHPDYRGYGFIGFSPVAVRQDSK